MKKVLVYTENYQRGGGNQYLIDLINSIPLNYNVTIGSNKGGIFEEDFKKIKRAYSYQEVPIKSLPILNAKIAGITKNKALLFLCKVAIFALRYFILSSFMKGNFKKLLSLIDANQPDLVFSCNGGYPGGLSCQDCILAAKSRKIDVWLSVVSMPQKKSGIDALYKDIFSKLDKLIVNSKSIADEFINTRNVQPSKVLILHNCLANDSIMTSPVLQTPYSNAILEYKIGYVGRIEQTKGVFYLLEAFARLSGTYQNLKLVMVGNGNDFDQAKAYCVSHGIEDKVEFTGYYFGQVGKILETLDLFVFPSLWEGLPYSILEAMANSKIVISTNVGGIPEIITDGHDGFLVPPADADSLFEKIKYVLQEGSSQEQIIINSLNTINSRFSESFFKDKLESLFSERDTLRS